MNYITGIIVSMLLAVAILANLSPSLEQGGVLTVSTDGTTYYLSDYSGNPVLNNVNASYILQQAVSKAQTGDTIFVKAGVYLISPPIQFNKPVNLMCEDESTTILKGTSATKGVLLVGASSMLANFSIRNCTIDTVDTNHGYGIRIGVLASSPIVGLILSHLTIKSSNSTFQVGIFITGYPTIIYGNSILIDHIQVLGERGMGIFIHWFSGLVIQNSYFDAQQSAASAAGDGVWMNSADHVMLLNNTFLRHEHNALRSSGNSTNITILNNYVHVPDHSGADAFDFANDNGLLTNANHNVLIQGNRAINPLGNYGTGAVDILNGGSYFVVFNNTFTNVDVDIGNNTSTTAISSNNYISSNTLISTTPYHHASVTEIGMADYNTIIFNRLFGSSRVTYVGAHSIVYANG